MASGANMATRPRAGRYVGAPEAEEDDEPFEAKMARLMADLSGQVAESSASKMRSGGT